MTTLALTDHDLLSRLTGGSHDLSAALLERFGTAARAINADAGDLLGCPGMDPSMLAAFETVRVAVAAVLRPEVSEKPVLSSWHAVLDYLRGTMAHLPVETLRILYLDRVNRLIVDETPWRGTVNDVCCYPREIMRRAIELRASAIILAHNHPSGDPTPSQPDTLMTRKVVEAGDAVGIVVHDHVIVSQAGHHSFRTAGLM
jgi:DNA repair protein RadC